MDVETFEVSVFTRSGWQVDSKARVQGDRGKMHLHVTLSPGAWTDIPSEVDDVRLRIDGVEPLSIVPVGPAQFGSGYTYICMIGGRSIG